MRESSTFQAILREGRQEGLREGRIEGGQRVLILLGTDRYGAPDAATLAAIEAINELDRLKVLCLRILNPRVRGWADLLRDS